jgi:hypothetical protein
MRTRTALVAAVAAGLAASSLAVSSARAEYGVWRRTISFQSKQDLFYNNYVGPIPSGTAAAMYVSPRPVPPHVGWTYITYQPYMPQEYLYKHTRSHYAWNPGAGWSRAKIRYRTAGLRLDDWGYRLNGEDEWPHMFPGIGAGYWNHFHLPAN